MRIAIYALGSGHSHAMRGLALARALQEQPTQPDRSRTQCLVMARDSMKEWARVARVPTATPPPMAHRDAEMLAGWVATSLREYQPDVLVVDTFPRGMLNELGDVLPTLAPRRILMSPWVNPRFYLRPDIATAISTHYDAVAWCEPPADELKPLLEQCRRVERVPPLLFVRPQDVEPSTAGRQTFGVHEMDRVVLGVGAGDAATERGQLDALIAASRKPGLRFRVLFFAHHLPATESNGASVVNIFPAGAWLRTCPVLVTSAGYQSYYEAVQANVPVVFRPLPRPIDDQTRRARGEMGLVSIAPHAVVEDDDALASAIHPLLVRELQRRHQKRGLSEDVEMRGPAVGGAAAAADTVLGIARTAD